MRRLSYVCIAALVFALTALPAALASPDSGKGDRGNSEAARKGKPDNRKHPLGAKQTGLLQRALEAKAAGQAKGKVHEVAKGQYVQLEREGTDKIFVVLAEFSDQIHPLTGGTAGPAHNAIAQPDRATDNSTIWQSDFNRAHFEDMYFNKMARYYETQSSGRYSVRGAVTEWVKVPYNEARYGSNSFGDSIVWALIRDSIRIWTADQIAAGKTPAQVREYLKTFDVQDRYDYDQDGNFNESDGYIDHFQIVHAGAGEETGGGAQGSDAIWSHRWYAYYNGIGTWGPADGPKFGGAQFGGTGSFGHQDGPNATGVWVGDYTIQPENGGLGVFAHEFGHDLGLPDHYDTSYLGENSSAFWTIMSSGSYLGPADGNGIGTRPGDFSAWDKFALGWLNYDVAFAGKRSSHRLGPAETNTKAAQGLFVVLPKRERTLELGKPPVGNLAWWSQKGDNLDNAMTRTVAIPAGATTLTAKLWYDIEVDWDYAYVSVSTDNGAEWTNLASSGITTTTNPNGQNFGNGITGSSNGWQDASFDVSAYAGQTVQLRLRYWTDGFVEGKGFMADEITVGSFSDGAEAGDNGWTLNGFRASNGVEKSLHNNYYVAEYRQYRGYDTGLKTGPYNFVSGTSDWVEHFPYQDGLLISYWDTYWGEDNGVGAHPGEGFLLPIDAHPEPLIAKHNNEPQRTRIQVYDATFGLEPTDPITLTRDGVATTHPSLPAVPVFDDRNQFWFASKPDSGVKVPNTGTQIEVVRPNTQGNFMQVNVKPAG